MSGPMPPGLREHRLLKLGVSLTEQGRPPGGAALMDWLLAIDDVLGVPGGGPDDGGAGQAGL